MKFLWLSNTNLTWHNYKIQQVVVAICFKKQRNNNSKKESVKSPNQQTK